MTPNSKALALANKWRSENPARVSGVVLVWQGKVYAWKDKLRDPSCERPGAIAVDYEGHMFLAEGGNDDSGASVWTVINQINGKSMLAIKPYKSHRVMSCYWAGSFILGLVYLFGMWDGSGTVGE